MATIKVFLVMAMSMQHDYLYMTSYPYFHHRTTATTGDSMQPHCSCPTVVHGPQTQLPIGGTREHAPGTQGGMMRADIIQK